MGGAEKFKIGNMAAVDSKCLILTDVSNMGSKITFARYEVTSPTVYNMSTFEHFLFSPKVRTGRYDDVTMTLKMKIYLRF